MHLVPFPLHSRKMKGVYTIAIAPIASRIAISVMAISKIRTPHKMNFLQQRNKNR